MNKVILMGRLTRDPEVRYTSGEEAKAIGRYTLAVDRRFKRERSRCRFHKLRGLWPTGRICREIFPPGHKDPGDRPNSDRELHQ